MNKANRIFSGINIGLSMVYWLAVFPLSHFGPFLDESTPGSAINIATMFFVILVIANGLWCLSSTLVLHMPRVVRIMLFSLGLVCLDQVIHFRELPNTAPLVLPFLVTALMLFALSQVRCSEYRRNLMLWTILGGCTVNAVMHDVTFVIQYNMEPPQSDSILASIGIAVSLYMLLRARPTVLMVLGNLFALIFLYLYFLHHISVKAVFVVVPSCMVLLGLLFKEKTQIGIMVSAVMLICTWLTHLMEFYADFDLIEELNHYWTNTLAHVRTASAHLLYGHGHGTFAMANLESNPNYYTERAYSTVLHLLTIGGIFALVPLLLAWYALIRTSLGKHLTWTEKAGNICLVLPFILATVVASVSVFSMPVFYAMATVIWYNSAQDEWNKRIIDRKKLVFGRVPIAITTLVLLTYCATALVSIFQLDRIIRNNDCGAIEDHVINPLPFNMQISEFEMTCVYNNLMILPVDTWLARYREIVTKEIIPFHPKKVFFEQLIALEDHYTPEEREEIREMADRLYPTLVMEMDEKKHPEAERESGPDPAAGTRDTGSGDDPGTSGEPSPAPESQEPASAAEGQEPPSTQEEHGQGQDTVPPAEGLEPAPSQEEQSPASPTEDLKSSSDHEEQSHNPVSPADDLEPDQGTGTGEDPRLTAAEETPLPETPAATITDSVE